MSTEDPTYEEVWREFHNFTFQTLPNLERLKIPLKKAADIETFLQNSASTVADQQAAIDRMAALADQRRTMLDSVNADIEKAKTEQRELTTQHHAELSALTRQIADVASRLDGARISMDNELAALSTQRAELQNANAALSLQIDARQRELAGIRDRIAAANAALK